MLKKTKEKGAAWTSRCIAISRKNIQEFVASLGYALLAEWQEVLCQQLQRNDPRDGIMELTKRMLEPHPQGDGVAKVHRGLTMGRRVSPGVQSMNEMVRQSHQKTSIPKDALCFSAARTGPVTNPTLQAQKRPRNRYRKDSRARLR